MNYWLMKTEPSTYSITDLKNAKNRTTAWEGVRNYQARNFMRDNMKLGDQTFFYHSSCQHPGIVAITKVVRESYPDPSALDPESSYFDPKSTADNPRWFMVDVQLVRVFKTPISLKMLNAHPELSELLVLKRGNRLSITPVTKPHWNFILALETS